MAASGFEGTVEVVRGRLGEERAQQLVDFWSTRGLLGPAAARERLDQVVCVALDASGEIIGVNSVYAADVSLLSGRRFWVYRSFLVPEHAAAAALMINTAFGELEPEYERNPDGPIGLCIALAERDLIERRREAIWPETQLMYAGYTPDDQQVRVRYFEDAVIGPGYPNSPTLEETRNKEYPLGETYRIEAFDETSSVSGGDVLALWRQENVMPEEMAQQRVNQVAMVALERDAGLVGIATIYLRWNQQLRMQAWHFRTYVAEQHRHTSLAAQLTFQTRDLVEGRFVSGEDRRAEAMIMEVEHLGLRTYFNRAVGLPSDFTFIGENRLGYHVRVHYFPGSEVPLPSRIGAD